MLSQKDKLKIARRWMETAKNEYEDLMKVEAVAMGSMGLTARYDAMGGGGSGLSDHTANIAMTSVKVTETYWRKMQWLDVIMDVYGYYASTMDKKMYPKSLLRMAHDRAVARVLYGRVFRGWTMKEIGESLKVGGMDKTRQGLSKLSREAVEMIAELADERGLYG